MDSIHRGVRFAPSPTGRFHIGNLRTAWISREWARKLGQPWVVRFEDIDTPRVVQGACQQQMDDLKSLGLIPDQYFLQSERRPRHWSLFQKGVNEGILYPCFCSRKEVQESLAGLASAPHGVLPLYSGRCRETSNHDSTSLSQFKPKHDLAWRFRSAHSSGAQDFIVARTVNPIPDEACFVPSYHWACAIDDFDGNYSLLVRASDLATSILFQREIQGWVSRATEKKDRLPPAVFHTSLVVQNDGVRLEKRTAGVTLSELLSSGQTSETLLEIFKKTFSISDFEFQVGKIFGERRECVTLKALGF